MTVVFTFISGCLGDHDADLLWLQFVCSRTNATLALLYEETHNYFCCILLNVYYIGIRTCSSLGSKNGDGSSVVEVYWHFRGTCYLHHLGNDWWCRQQVSLTCHRMFTRLQYRWQLFTSELFLKLPMQILMRYFFLCPSCLMSSFLNKLNVQFMLCAKRHYIGLMWMSTC